jgi:hypothetical protein
MTVCLYRYAQNVMVYPAQGQTPDQVSRDRYECHTWAVQQTGYDPSSGAASPQSNSQQESVRRETLKGGARGAAIEAAAGGMKRRFAQKNANQAASSSAANDAANNYNRALGACLSGRGYTVQ